MASRISEVMHAGGTTLLFNVGCAPDLEVTLVAERDDAVVLSATHVPAAPDEMFPACLETYYVELRAPLADRQLLDQNGDVIEDVTQVPEVTSQGARRVD